MNESVNKYYNQFKDQIDKLDLPANIVTVIIIGFLLLWMILGFSGSIMVIVLFITNIVCLYYLYKKNYIKINV